MSRRFGGQSEFAPLRRAVVSAPSQAFGVAVPETWHYAGTPNLERAQVEHRALVALLEASGTSIERHDQTLPDLADALYVYDPVLVTDRGTIVLRMGKPLRRGEEAALAATLQELGLPIVGVLEGEATAEAGDTLWLDQETLAVGCGFRTNHEGVRQLRALLEPGVRVVAVDLPYHHGPDACLHLKSIISMLDERLAVGHLELMPVGLYRQLRERGVELVPVPADEFATQACNVLAVGPRDCVMLEGNPQTEVALQRRGCRVRRYSGEEISLKAEGGPTCLTRPIWRG